MAWKETVFYHSWDLIATFASLLLWIFHPILYGSASTTLALERIVFGRVVPAGSGTLNNNFSTSFCVVVSTRIVASFVCALQEKRSLSALGIMEGISP